MSSDNKKIALGKETRLRIVHAAQTLFERGYEAVGTPEIARAADVTRGALYHHFADKKALFDAVLCEVAADIVRDIDVAALRHEDKPLDAIRFGSLAFIDACQAPAVRQIFLVDGPSVLGWARWRQIDASYGLGALIAGLSALASAQRLSADRVEPLAHLLSGALNEAAFYVADPFRTPEEVGQMMDEVSNLVGAMLA